MTHARDQLSVAALVVVALLAAFGLGLLAAPRTKAQTSSPAAPANLRAEYTNDGVRIRWDDPGDPSITGYEFRFRLSGVDWWTPDWTLLSGSSASTTALALPYCETGVSGRIGVRARNAHGSGAASSVTFASRNCPSDPPDPPTSSGSSNSSSSSSSSGRRSSSPSAPAPTPATTPQPTVVGRTSSATATEGPDNRLHIQRHDLPAASLKLPVGSISADCATVVMAGIIRDQTRGQTYLVVRRQSDGQIVRRWVSPDSHLVNQIPWPVVNTQYTVAISVVAAVPLDDQCPQPNLLARRFDGGDDRIFSYHAALRQWRHVPDIPTFQALGFYWCNVVAADSGFFERITRGPDHPATTTPANPDHPDCLTS